MDNRTTKPEKVFSESIELALYLLNKLHKDYRSISFKSGNWLEKNNVPHKAVKTEQVGILSKIIRFFRGQAEQADPEPVLKRNKEKELAYKARKKSADRYCVALENYIEKVRNLPIPNKVPGRQLKSLILQSFNKLKFLKDTYGHHNMPIHKSMTSVIEIVDDLSKLITMWEQENGEYEEAESLHPRQEINLFSPKVTGKKNKIIDQRQSSLFLQGGVAHNVVSDADRIWLPVSASHRHELLKKGAKEDFSNGIKRGSHLWVHMEDRKRFENFLPLSYRKTPPKLEWPPIQRNAVGQNLWQVFDKDTWNHIRFNSYDRWGHRCQLCGKQFGTLWAKIASDKELQHPGPVDCHEVWEWERLEGTDMGIQRLKEVMVICKDCHATFHEGRTLKLAEKVGIEKKAERYITKLRMLTTHMNQAEVNQSLAKTREHWSELKDITKWVIDLSSLSQQNFMQGHEVVLKTNNVAGVEPDMIAGIAFKTDTGEKYTAQNIDDIVRLHDTQKYLL